MGGWGGSDSEPTEEARLEIANGLHLTDRVDELAGEFADTRFLARAPDLVTGNGSDASVSLLLGADGSFEAPVRIDVGQGAFPVHVADVDADGLPDIVTANELDGDVSIRLGRGDGRFGDDLRFAVGRSPYAVALGDVDRDGHLDLIAATGAADEIAVRTRNP